jgi:hypothetical protein
MLQKAAERRRTPKRVRACTRQGMYATGYLEKAMQRNDAEEITKSTQKLLTSVLK